MTVNAQDRIALILGRAIMRTEALQAQLEEAQKRIADFESNHDPDGDTDD